MVPLKRREVENSQDKAQGESPKEVRRIRFHLRKTPSQNREKKMNPPQHEVFGANDRCSTSNVEEVRRNKTLCVPSNIDQGL